MADTAVTRRELTHLAFLNRENQYRHHFYNEEMLQYEYLRRGDMRAEAEGRKMFSSPTVGHLSSDPVRNCQYLFIAAITLATRFAIEGGMDEQTAYDTSDLFINRVDLCRTVEEVRELHADMMRNFTQRVAEARKAHVFSKPIALCLSQIDLHLHELIRADDLAREVGLNPQYLSTLFKKEMGLTLSAYITQRRVEAAENMLKYSDYPYAQIASYLAFSSQSYFIRVFRQATGFTPRQYRERFFQSSFGGERLTGPGLTDR